MEIGKWTINIWKSNGFSFLFHYQGGWNDGTQKRLYTLWWEINADCSVEKKKLKMESSFKPKKL